MTDLSSAYGEDYGTNRFILLGSKLVRLYTSKLVTIGLVGDASEPCFLESFTLVSIGSMRLSPKTYLLQL